MIIKFTASGPGTMKYVITFWISQLILLAIWIQSSISHGIRFMTLLENSLNSQQWDLLSLLTPIGIIILYYFCTEVILGIIAYLLFKRMSNKFGFK